MTSRAPPGGGSFASSEGLFGWAGKVVTQILQRVTQPSVPTLIRDASLHAQIINLKGVGPEGRDTRGELPTIEKEEQPGQARQRSREPGFRWSQRRRPRTAVEARSVDFENRRVAL
jgi:hypothetical protein